MKIKIGTRLMAAGAAIIIVSFAVMGTVVSLRTEQGIKNLVGENLSALTNSMADYVGQYPNRIPSHRSGHSFDAGSRRLHRGLQQE